MNIITTIDQSNRSNSDSYSLDGSDREVYTNGKIVIIIRQRKSSEPHSFEGEVA